jgi:hypothetical protein
LWASKTKATNTELKFLEGGNLVIAVAGKLIWQTNTTGATEVSIQNGCNFVVQGKAGPLWVSNSKCLDVPTPAPPLPPPPPPTLPPSLLPPHPLNVLMIISDQHRSDALSEAGNTVIHTPNLDKLAQEGVRFTKAYTICPVCVPSRSR